MGCTPELLHGPSPLFACHRAHASLLVVLSLGRGLLQEEGVEGCGTLHTAGFPTVPGDGRHPRGRRSSVHIRGLHGEAPGRGSPLSLRKVTGTRSVFWKAPWWPGCLEAASSLLAFQNDCHHV